MRFPENPWQPKRSELIRLQKLHGKDANIALAVSRAAALRGRPAVTKKVVQNRRLKLGISAFAVQTLWQPGRILTDEEIRARYAGRGYK